MDENKSSIFSRSTFLKDLLIVAAINIVFLILPAPGAITSAGMLIFGCFISVIYVMVSRRNTWLSLLALFYYSQMQQLGFGAALASVMGNQQVVIIIFALAFANVMAGSGMAKYLTTNLLRIPIAKKGPYLFMFVMFFTSFISAFVSQAILAIIVVLFGVLNEYCKQVGMKEHSRYEVISGIGIAVSAGAGLFAAPYSFNFQIFRAVVGGVGLVADMNVLAFNLIVATAWFFGSILMVLIAKHVFRTQINIENFDAAVNAVSSEKAQFTRQIGWSFGAIGVLMLGLAVPSIFSAGDSGFGAIIRQLDFWGPAGSFVLALIFLCVAPDGKKKGETIFNFAEKLRNSVDWGVVWNVGITLFLGAFLANNDMTGIPAFMSSTFSPLTGLTPIFAVLLLGVVANLLSNAMSATALLFIFGALMTTIVGGDPLLTAAAITALILGVDGAFALPSSGGAAVWLHSQAKMFKPRDLIGFGFLYSVVANAVQMTTIFLLYRLLI
jgi:hypothetical protein